MAKFNWAYVDCDREGSAAGPTGSVQYLTGAGFTSGSAEFIYHTSSQKLFLTGTLIVSGAISASGGLFVKEVSKIVASGSSDLGDSNDDFHWRTGSLVVTTVDGQRDFNATGSFGDEGQIFSASLDDKRVWVYGFGGRYRRVTTAAGVAMLATDFMIGLSASANQIVYLPTASAVEAGAQLVIKDEYRDRSSTKVTIFPSVGSGNLIDGLTTFVLTGTLPAINLYSNGAHWFVY
tara:strand:- start:917 stop:1618 length:702 start_codon:yes stop_codon:yes gene_type:complete